MAMEGRFYLLRIRLCEIEPEIWRRFVVPWDISLDRLHDVIQIVMGWEDYHLHEFTIGKKRYTEYPESKEDGLTEGKYRLLDLIRRKGRTFSYLYDFGDEWEHEILIEDSRYFDPQLDVAVTCLEGARACPPEDVGGIYRYQEFCEALRDPVHPENDSWLTWCDGKWEPERFDLDTVNDELLKYLRWSRNRHIYWWRIW